jgi:hypothetical protein
MKPKVKVKYVLVLIKDSFEILKLYWTKIILNTIRSDNLDKIKIEFALIL